MPRSQKKFLESYPHIIIKIDPTHCLLMKTKKKESLKFLKNQTKTTVTYFLYRVKIQVRLINTQQMSQLNFIMQKAVAGYHDPNKGSSRQSW
jgi:hypothetical protein